MSKEKFDKKLLVEGINDLHVISNLCQVLNIPENFDIIDCNSCKGVFDQLETRLSNPNNCKTIGLVLDADQNSPNDRLQALKNRLNGIPYIFPAQVPNGGLIVNPPQDKHAPKMGLWVMPDNIRHGMLEDFVIELVPENDQLLPKAELVITDIEAITPLPEGRFKDVHRSKAKVHSYLAWKDEPGTPMGQAITKRILDPNSESALVFADWLKQLFN